MKTSKNYNLGKNKFFNIAKGKKENTFFFVFPTIVISPKHFLYWDTVMFSIFVSWGNYYLQLNICEIVKNTNTEVYRETMNSLMNALKAINMEVADGPAALSFLNKNTYITQIIKNADLNHNYIKMLFTTIFQNQPFIKSR